MTDQPLDRNQIWHVGQKWCQFMNALQKSRGLPQKNWGAKTSHFLPTFLATSALVTSYLWNETSRRQTKILMSIYNMSTTS